MAKDSGIPKDRSSESDLVDLGWDDDASGPIQLGGAVPDLVPDLGERVTAVPAEPDYAKRAMAQADEHEEKSGVQPIGERPTPAPEPALSFDVPGLDIDEPMERRSYDDLSVELRSGKTPDPMLLGASLELDLETPLAPSVEDPTVGQMRDRYAAGDFTGALVLAESLLETEPDHPDALRFAESCRDVLMQMYAARLGSLDQRVSVAIPPDQVRWLSLDHRAGFLLSLVDGSSTVEEILDISGMPRLDALRIMYTLFEQQIIGLAAGGPPR